MKAFGLKRTYGDCRVIRAGWGRKIKVKLFVKSHKFGRVVSFKEFQ